MHRLVALGQAAAKLAVDQLEQQRVGLRLVEDAEPGIDAGFHGMGPQQRAAERMDRADPRRVELADQAEPMLDLRLGGLQEPLAVQAARMRSRISRAARSVNVIAVNWSSRGPSCRHRRPVPGTRGTAR